VLSKIYYFSGTGNCLATARKINENSLYKNEIISIPSVISKPLIKADRVGLVFPVYCHKVPKLVEQFLLKAEFASSPYIYAVATHAGAVGQSLFDVQNLFEKKNQSLSLGIELAMPGNAIAIAPGIEIERLSSLEQRAAEIAKLTDIQSKGHIDGNNGITENIRNKIVDLIAYKYIFAPKRFKITGNCTGCGICEKICPVNNIRMVESKPIWGNDCAACLACFHWCPKEAVYMSNSVIGKRRKYHHPDISVSDMIQANGC